MSSREQFEAWWESEGYDEKLNYVRGIMFNRIKANMFFAWQAATSAMEAKCAALAAELKQSQIDAGCYKKGMEASNERLVQVAAENAGMKSAIDATIGWQQSTDPENVESVRMLVGIKTPATDTWLAEVRASELDSLAGVAETMLVRFANQGASEIPDAKGWEIVRRQASHRSAQLRKGVQS